MSDLLLLCRIHFLKHFKIIIASCCCCCCLRAFPCLRLPSFCCCHKIFAGFFVVKTTLLTCSSIKRSWNSPFANEFWKIFTTFQFSHALQWSHSQPRFTSTETNSIFVFTRMMRIFRNAAKWLIACCLCINANQAAAWAQQHRHRLRLHQLFN